MKKLLPFFLVVLSSIAFAQMDIVTEPIKPPKPKGDASTVILSYDKFKELTTIITKGSKLYAEGKYSLLFPDATFTAGGAFAGEKVYDGPVRYYLHFRFESPDWVFLRTSTDMIILMGSARMNLKGTRTGDVSSGRGKVSVVERLIYHISQNQMEILANAEVVELQIGGGFQITLSPKEREQLLSVLAAVDLKK